MHGVAPQMCGRVASPLLGRGAGGRSPATYAASIGGLGPNAVSLVSEREERWHTFEAEHLAVVCNLPPIANHHCQYPPGAAPSACATPTPTVDRPPVSRVE